MTVFLYAGQGAQTAGMGKDFYEAFPEYREVCENASFDFDHIKLMHEGPEEKLMQTKYTQPCMAVFAAGVTEVLKARGITPDAAAGLSLGEYSALYSAGVWDLRTFLDIVAFRGRAMQKAAEKTSVLMSAVIGTEASIVEKVCVLSLKEGFVSVANYNCPGQYVICGEERAVVSAEKILKEEHKARCVRLKTSGAFHTKLMKDASDELELYFQGVEFNKPLIKVAGNYSGGIYSESDDIKAHLVKQACSSVRFEDCLKSLLNEGADRFIEIGPKTVLSGLLKKTAKAVNVSPEIITVGRVGDMERI